MAIYKCKMCGGSLDITEGQSVYECEYCGTKQTLPRLDDEKRLGLYNRASQFRQRCAFDKAAGIYEKIVEETPDDAEAHWSLVLCRYGIEYVEDPGTGDRIPTCHRASMDPIFDDVDYIDAIKYADPIATGLYKKEAARIDWILKGILEISAKEEPYDVFICYKETNDSTGDRTLDSVKAQEIYDALTEKGYKVFFSRITLEGKLGKDYESIIFAALNSAKVMLVVTADPDNTEAVWVKNEWSRYLKIMAKNKGRVLIPCYLKMDPYLLPDEFSNLQGQDMGKIGFLQDLVRGIGKIIPKKTAQQQTAAVPQGVVASFSSLLKRAELFLESGDFENASSTCDKILDADPENGDAYYIKLLAEFQLKNADSGGDLTTDISESGNYKMLMRFGSSVQKDKIKKLRMESIFTTGLVILEGAKKTDDCYEAISIFEKIPEHPESAEKIKECKERINEIRYDMAMSGMKAAASAEDYSAIQRLFRNLDGYRDSDKKADECGLWIEFKNAEAAYKAGKTKEELMAAKEQFDKLGDFADSKKRSQDCVTKYKSDMYDKGKAALKAEDYPKAVEYFKESEGYLDSKSLYLSANDKIVAAQQKEEKTKKVRKRQDKMAKVTTFIFALCIIGTAVLLHFNIRACLDTIAKEGDFANRHFSLGYLQIPFILTAVSYAVMGFFGGFSAGARADDPGFFDNLLGCGILSLIGVIGNSVLLGFTYGFGNINMLYYFVLNVGLIAIGAVCYAILVKIGNAINLIFWG